MKAQIVFLLFALVVGLKATPTGPPGDREVIPEDVALKMLEPNLNILPVTTGNEISKDTKGKDVGS